MTERSLQRLYEDPATPLGSGLERAQMQATIPAEIASSSPRPLASVDIGCGDGIVTAVRSDPLRTDARSERHYHRPRLVVRCARSRAAARHPRGACRDGRLGPPSGFGSVGVVIMSELIEHLVDTDAALTQAGRVLVPGGSLPLSAPDLAAWCNRVLLALGLQLLFTEVSLRGICGRPGREVVGHLRAFTRRALEELLASAGLVERTHSLSSILLASARWPA